MQDIKNEILKFINKNLGLIQIYNCWHYNELICDIHIMKDNSFLINMYDSFPYMNYNSNFINLPSRFYIHGQQHFDFFLKNFYGFTANFFLLDNQNEKYCYPSTFMSTENITWVGECIQEIRDFIFFCRHIIILD